MASTARISPRIAPDIKLPMAQMIERTEAMLKIGEGREDGVSLMKKSSLDSRTSQGPFYSDPFSFATPALKPPSPRRFWKGALSTTP